jgi:SAM-dependent methyltransferase
MGRKRKTNLKVDMTTKLNGDGIPEEYIPIGDPDCPEEEPIVEPEQEPDFEEEPEILPEPPEVIPEPAVEPIPEWEQDPDVEPEPEASRFEEDFFRKSKEAGCDYAAKGTWQVMYAKYLDRLFALQYKRVLDLGCALGAITSAIADHGADVIGVDISKFAYQHTHFVNFAFLNTPAWDLKKIEDNTVDFIHSMHLLNHLTKDELEKTFKEIVRVSKDGAIMFMVMKLDGEDVDPLIHNHKRVEMDALAAKYGMKNGSSALASKLKMCDPGWDFITKYKWDVLIYQVKKE